MLSLDENLFVQQVNMAQIEHAYDQIAQEVASKNITEESFARIQAMNEREHFLENLNGQYGLFFVALKQQLIQTEKHCLSHKEINQRPGTATPMFDTPN